MRQSIQQCSRHLGIVKHTRPFAKAEIGGDDQAGFFLQLADQVEQ